MTTPLVVFKKSRPTQASRLKLQQRYSDDEAEQAPSVDASAEQAPSVDASVASSIIRPKKVLNRTGSGPVFRSAASRRETPITSAAASDDEGGPASQTRYSTEYLSSLRDSTPSTPLAYKSDLVGENATEIAMTRLKPSNAADDFIALDASRQTSRQALGEDDFSLYEEGADRSRVLFGSAEGQLHDRLRQTQIEDAFDTLQDHVQLASTKEVKAPVTLLSSDERSDDEDDNAWEATQIRKATLQRTSDLAGLHATSSTALLTDTQASTGEGLLPMASDGGMRTFRGPPMPILTPLATFPQMVTAMQIKLAQTQARLVEQRGIFAALEAELAGITEEELVVKTKLAQASGDYERLRIQVGGLDAM